MKRFIRSCILFILSVVLTTFGLEYLSRIGATKFDAYAMLAKKMEARKDSITTAFFGSSLIANAVNDELWDDEAINFAVYGESPEQDYYMAKEIIPQLPALRTVVLEIGYLTLRDYREFLPEHPRTAAWFRPTVFFHTKKKSRWSADGWLFLHPTAFRDDLNALFKNKPADPLEAAWTSSYNVTDTAAWLSDAKGHGYPQTYLPVHFKFNFGHIEETVKMAKERGVNVVIVIPPVTPEFYQVCREDQRKEMMAAALWLQRSYGVKIVNAFEDSRYTHSDFHDSFHINRSVGTYKFTRNLLYDIKVDTARTIIHR